MKKIEEVYKNIFSGDVWLPKSPLKSINVYVIKSEEKMLVVDSGFDHHESEKAFFSLLDDMGAKEGNVDMYLTHLHADHSGLAYKFQQKYKGKVYCSEKEAKYINAMTAHDYFSSELFSPKLLGIDADEHFFDTHPATIHSPKGEVDFTYIKEGDKIVIGDYNFEVVGIPGHTPDQTALYEPAHKLLFSGDHILDKITPNISFWGFEYGDILGIYLKNLQKVYDMDVNIVFPSHRTIIEDHKKRISDLIRHHNERLEDIMEILSSGEYFTVAEVAAKMHWDFRAESFDEFPPTQKWFAAGEAMSHLEHLREKGLVEIQRGETVFYKKK